MKSFFNKLVRLLRDESGPTAVEYSVMVMLVILICLTGITLIGENTAANLDQSNTSIEKAIDEAP